MKNPFNYNTSVEEYKVKSTILCWSRFIKTHDYTGLPIEFYKNLHTDITEEIVIMCNKIYDRSNWPKDSVKTVKYTNPNENRYQKKWGM